MQASSHLTILWRSFDYVHAACVGSEYITDAHEAEQICASVLTVELLRRKAEVHDPRRTLDIIDSTVVRCVLHLAQQKTRWLERYRGEVRPIA